MAPEKHKCETSCRKPAIAKKKPRTETQSTRTDRHTQRDRETQREKERERKRQRQRETERHRDIETD